MFKSKEDWASLRKQTIVQMDDRPHSFHSFTHSLILKRIWGKQTIKHQGIHYLERETSKNQCWDPFTDWKETQSGGFHTELGVFITFWRVDKSCYAGLQEERVKRDPGDHVAQSLHR